MLSAGILFGIVAMLSMGLADFLAKGIVDRMGVLNASISFNLIGMIPLSIYVLTAGSASFPVEMVELTVINGILRGISLLFFYKALRMGLVSLVSSAGSIYPAVTVILAHFFLHENLTHIEILGIASVILGVLLVGFNYLVFKSEHDGKALTGVCYAVVAAVGFGISSLLTKVAADYSTTFNELITLTLLTSLITVLFLYSNLIISKTKLAFPKGELRTRLLVTSLLYSVFIISFFVGASADNISIISPVASSSSIITVLLATVILYIY